MVIRTFSDTLRTDSDAGGSTSSLAGFFLFIATDHWSSHLQWMSVAVCLLLPPLFADRLHCSYSHICSGWTVPVVSQDKVSSVGDRSENLTSQRLGMLLWHSVHFSNIGQAFWRLTVTNFLKTWCFPEIPVTTFLRIKWRSGRLLQKLFPKSCRESTSENTFLILVWIAPWDCVSLSLHNLTTRIPSGLLAVWSQPNMWYCI